ncbi:MAG: hypothetical protein FWE97_00035 [Dehalococcoidia bacterium]|nr:hypothetical protein [Dehalococcoidia bacterium]
MSDETIYFSDKDATLYQKQAPKPTYVCVSMPREWIDGATVSIDKILEYLASHGDGCDFTIEELFEWSRTQHIAPVILRLTCERLIIQGSHSATLEMFDLWARYLIDFLGEEDAMKYLREDLGCDMSSAPDSAKMAFFCPKHERP